jgi:hypothetical protein
VGGGAQVNDGPYTVSRGVENGAVGVCVRVCEMRFN